MPTLFPFDLRQLAETDGGLLTPRLPYRLGFRQADRTVLLRDDLSHELGQALQLRDGCGSTWKLALNFFSPFAPSGRIC